MAIDEHNHGNHRNHDGAPERDAHLARLMQAAGAESPPHALDAAIRAAARREVGARPQGVGGGGAVEPLSRRKHNWYVPVSIAAVVVMSASLVAIVHHEKGDELAQPPRSAPAPAVVTEPSAASKVGVPETPTAASAKADTEAGTESDTKADTKAGKPKLEVAQRDDMAASADKTQPADGNRDKRMQDTGKMAAQRLENQRTEGKARESSENRAASVGKITAGVESPRRESPAAPSAIVLPEPVMRPGVALGGGVADAPVLAPAPARDNRPAPFPPLSESTASPRQDAAPPRMRAEAERDVMRDAAAPAPAAAPQLEGRASASASPAPVAKPALKRSSPQQTPRPAWLTELDQQPPEKWLERHAQFRRDGRVAEADELMAEFRRRFPDHPASAR